MFIFDRVRHLNLSVLLSPELKLPPSLLPFLCSHVTHYQQAAKETARTPLPRARRRSISSATTPAVGTALTSASIASAKRALPGAKAGDEGIERTASPLQAEVGIFFPSGEERVVVIRRKREGVIICQCCTSGDADLPRPLAIFSAQSPRNPPADTSDGTFVITDPESTLQRVVAGLPPKFSIDRALFDDPLGLGASPPPTGRLPTATSSPLATVRQHVGSETAAGGTIARILPLAPMGDTGYAGPMRLLTQLSSVGLPALSGGP